MSLVAFNFNVLVSKFFSYQINPLWILPPLPYTPPVDFIDSHQKTANRNPAEEGSLFPSAMHPCQSYAK